jgi:hypothetical protein
VRLEEVASKYVKGTKQEDVATFDYVIVGGRFLDLTGVKRQEEPLAVRLQIVFLPTQKSRCSSSSAAISTTRCYPRVSY